jgi:hypothetical protein
MYKRLFYRVILGLGALLLLLPVKAWADFIIEFTEGRQVTVRRYVDEGRTIKIYIPQGTIGIRKEDVKRITEVEAHSKVSPSLETWLTWTSPSVQASAPVPSDKERRVERSQATKTDGKKTAEAGKATGAELERFDKQSSEVSQQLDELWAKHLQDVNSGASEEILAENRRRLNELNRERHKLIKSVRRTNPNDLPAWAR